MTDFFNELKNIETELENQENDQDTELFFRLVNRITGLLDQDPNYLMSMLYRLDVEERLLIKAMKDEDPATTIAHLIVQRQLQRIATKKKYS